MSLVMGRSPACQGSLPCVDKVDHVEQQGACSIHAAAASAVFQAPWDVGLGLAQLRTYAGGHFVLNRQLIRTNTCRYAGVQQIPCHHAVQGLYQHSICCRQAFKEHELQLVHTWIHSQALVSQHKHIKPRWRAHLRARGLCGKAGVLGCCRQAACIYPPARPAAAVKLRSDMWRVRLLS